MQSELVIKEMRGRKRGRCGMERRRGIYTVDQATRCGIYSLLLLVMMLIVLIFLKA